MKRRRRPNTVLERFQEHREQYLGAAYAAGKMFKNSRFPSQKKRQRARERLKERDEKLKEIGK